MRTLGGDVRRSLRRLVREEARFACILIDPPWRFKSWDGTTHRVQKGSRATPYRTLTIQQIKNLPLAKLAERDCILFCWGLNGMIPEVLEVLGAWGFTYKTIAFTWAKTTTTGTKWHRGLGHWTRQNTERCYLATRGRPKRIHRDVPELMTERRRQHSRKPDAQYPRIERLVAGPYLEVFARKGRVGWTAVGNEVNKFR